MLPLVAIKSNRSAAKPFAGRDAENLVGNSVSIKIASGDARIEVNEVNEALEHLRQGKARYRVVLTNDFS